MKSCVHLDSHFTESRFIHTKLILKIFNKNDLNIFRDYSKNIKIIPIVTPASPIITHFLYFIPNIDPPSLSLSMDVINGSSLVTCIVSCYFSVEINRRREGAAYWQCVIKYKIDRNLTISTDWSICRFYQLKKEALPLIGTVIIENSLKIYGNWQKEMNRTVWLELKTQLS